MAQPFHCNTYLLGALICLIAGMFFVSDSCAQGGVPVKVTGSRYTGFTAVDVARLYMEQHPRSRVVISHADDHEYIQALVDKTADILVTFGKLDDDLKQDAADAGLQLVEQVVGWGAIVLVVHPANPVSELTLEQVRKIFVGDYRNWCELGGLDEPIVAISRDEEVSGTETLFRHLVLHDSPLAQRTVRLFDRDICKALSTRNGSIADARYPEAIRGRIAGLVKIIAVKKDKKAPAVVPSVETVQGRTYYPISAPMVAYWDAQLSKGTATDFVTFWARKGLGSPYAGENDRISVVRRDGGER